MEMQKTKISHVISGTLLIAGTTIGAGMLGIPLLTAGSGFLPAVIVTLAVWIFMVATGFLFLEAILWMPDGANILSLANRFLGKKGKFLAGITFAFLYYCLLVAYYAAGAPILNSFLEALTGVSLVGWKGFAFYGLLFGVIVSFGIKWIDRLNYVLMAGLVISYIFLISGGASQVEAGRLEYQNWPKVFYAAPVLFSAFGYHNVIPSLTHYFHRNVKVLRFAIFWGTFIPLIVYLIWQWLIIGGLPKSVVAEALQRGQPVTEALQEMAGAPWIQGMGRAFGFFAIVTSLLGVAFSMVDFLGDGLNKKRTGRDRIYLCLLTFFPPFIFSALDPSIFLTALSIAGGFGEAFLNGILPVGLVWAGRYYHGLRGRYPLPGGRLSLTALFGTAFLVMLLEILFLATQ